LGASNPIRDADIAAISPHPPLVFANRGLAGIDGTISTARGIASGLGAAVVALMGDLTAIHDLTSLVIPAMEKEVDLTVVIADDRGGSIFSAMEYGAPSARIGQLADYFDRLFAVPHTMDLPAVIEALGHEVHTVTEKASLVEGLAGPSRGIRVFHVPLDRNIRADQESTFVSWGRASTRAGQT
jgi:2-succinyl-5-enolpyruvyl-6-hydroxy-3-cyclohexene-1-carboxylate synthase